MIVAALQDALLRLAALLTPGALRQDWLQEWRAELWYVRGRRGSGEATRFCLGAFADAGSIRYAHVREMRLSKPSPASPRWMLAGLAMVVCVVSAAAFSVPETRELLLPGPYAAARELVMISAQGRWEATTPTITAREYEGFQLSMAGRFRAFAHYRPTRLLVKDAAGRASELSVARASRNLFELLGVPIGGGELVVRESVWKDRFRAGRVDVGGQRATVAAILPDERWRLPGRFDAWLLEDEAPAADAKVFVLARSDMPHRMRHWHVLSGGVPYDCVSLDKRPSVYAFLLFVVLAGVIVPVTLDPGVVRYPMTSATPGMKARLGWWMFLIAKLILSAALAFFGIQLLAVLTDTPIQPHGWFLGYVLAFRWALIDQRRRCPVCLRSLGMPTPVGSNAGIFLEWHGTEFACSRGHGLLHVAEVPTSYSADRWLNLDSSWIGLFAPQRGSGK